MSIKSDVEELKSLDLEIKRVLGSLKKLRNSKKEIEKRVTSYLKERELPGVKHQGIVIRIDSKERKVNKKKEEREDAIMSLLLSSGIQNPKDMLSKINSVSKESRSSNKLKMSNI